MDLLHFAVELVELGHCQLEVEDLEVFFEELLPFSPSLRTSLSWIRQSVWWISECFVVTMCFPEYLRIAIRNRLDCSCLILVDETNLLIQYTQNEVSDTKHSLKSEKYLQY